MAPGRRGRDRQAPGRAATAPGERVGMAKIKRVRTIDAVVMGWRPGKEEGTVGSLILGLYDDAGRAAHGRPHLRASRPSRSASCRQTLAPYETGERGMGDPSRWDNARDLEWIALRPELVVEVTFDHTSNDRIRHGTKLEALARRQGAATRLQLMEQLALAVRVMPFAERPVLVAPDSFKGTFSAAQVAGAIGRGLERAGLMPPDLCPVADGGEGTLDALLPQLGGELIAVEVRGPLGAPREGRVRAGRGWRDGDRRDGDGERARAGGRGRA